MKVLYIEDAQKLYRDTLAHNCYLLHIILSHADPGVPYTVTVRASTTIGKGEPVSIVVFSVEQGMTLIYSFCPSLQCLMMFATSFSNQLANIHACFPTIYKQKLDVSVGIEILK